MSNNKPPAPAGLRRSALAMAVLLAASVLPPALAQAQPAPARQAYAIAAGSLEEVLIRFSATAGLALSFEPALVEGLRSTGLNGSFGAEEGLRRVLQGSGLEAQTRGADAYVLRKLPAAPAAAVDLPAIRVEGKTEGTGSYTTGLTNTATKLNLSLRETPQSVTVMTRQRMQDQGLTDVAQVLEQAVGVHFHNTNAPGADYNEVYSRGFVLQNYQVNGVPRSTRFGAQEEMSDTLVYDRAEIVRGASGLLNGIGEPSGAINLVRKLPTREFQGSAAVQLGSWRRRRVEADISGSLNESGRVRGRLAAGHQDSDGFVDRLNAKRDVLYGVVEADLTPSTVLTAGVEYQRHRGTGAADAYSGAPIFYADGVRTHFGRSTNLALDWASTSRQNTSVFTTLEHYFDNEWRLRMDVEHSRRQYNMVMPSAAVLESNSDGAVSGFRWDGKPRQSSLTLHASGPYQLLGRRHELVVGGSHMRADSYGRNYKSFYEDVPNVREIIRSGRFPLRDMSPTGARSSTHDVQSGLYAATRLNPVDGLSVILGSRLSNWQTRSDRFSAAGVMTRGETRKESAVVTPYAGVVYDLTDTLSVYGSYTDIFQPATQFDAQGSLLDPAEGSNLEAGVKAAFFDNKLNLSAAAYRTKKDNVPEYVPGPGGKTNYGPTGQYVYKAIDGTQTTGFELEVSGELARGWQLAGGYSHAKPRDSQGKERLTYLPTKTFKLFTSYQPTAWLPGLTLGANVRWQASVYSAGNFDYRQGSVTLVDLMAQYAITRNLTATLNINNVFDKTYYTDVQVSGWYGEPRSAYLNLRYAFK